MKLLNTIAMSIVIGYMYMFFTSCNHIIKEPIKTENITVKIEKINSNIDTINITIPKDNGLIIHASFGIYKLCYFDTSEFFTRTLYPIKDGVIEFKILSFDNKFKFVKYEDRY